MSTYVQEFPLRARDLFETQVVGVVHTLLLLLMADGINLGFSGILAYTSVYVLAVFYRLSPSSLFHVCHSGSVLWHVCR